MSGQGPGHVDGLDGPSAAAWSTIADLASGSRDSGETDATATDGNDAAPFDVAETQRYRRGLVLGEGGMGRVTQAFDMRLGREVALKEVVAQSPAHEARLAREAAITARLDHPGIVVVHDAGRTPDGALFYTMRVVRGRTLDQVLAGAPDLNARLRVLRQVLHACEAVAFAHRHGVVHRDLKPSNIMLGEFGETQVIDWGLARVVGAVGFDAPSDSDAPTSPDLTRHGTVVGTPRYMSPEQAAGAPPSPLADVWSLGAIVFEVCAGRPLRAAMGNPAAEVEQAFDFNQLRTDAPNIPRDLAALVSRALAPPATRYPDAKALAEDLAAWLDGRRIAAHSYTPWELLRRAVWAWRVPLAIGLGALVATIVGLAFAFAEADSERDRAVEAEDQARRAERDASQAFDHADAARIRADRALSRLLSARAAASAIDDARPEAEVLAAHAFALEPSPEARGAVMTLSRAGRPELLSRTPLPPRCANADVTPDLSALVCADDSHAAYYPLALPSPIGQPRWRAGVSAAWGITTFEAKGAVVTSSAHEPVVGFAMRDAAPVLLPATFCCTYPPASNLAGNAVAFAGTAQLTVMKGNDVLEISPCARREELAGAIDDRGEHWAVSCGDGALFVGRLGAAGVRHETPLRAPRGPAATLAFTPDGNIVLGTSDGRLVVFDPENDVVVHDVASGVMMSRQIAISPDGRWAVVAGDRGAPRLFDLASGTWRGRLPNASQIRRFRFVRGRDADLVAIGDALHVWRLHPGDASSMVVGGGVTGLVASPDEEILAVTRGKGVELRDIASGRFIAATELDGIVKPGAFSPDGTVFAATNGVARRIERWQGRDMAAYAQPFSSPTALNRLFALRNQADEPMWVAIPHHTGLMVWPDKHDTPLRVFEQTPYVPFRAVAVRADLRRAVLLTLHGEIWWFDAAAPQLVFAFAWPGATALAIDPAGTHVLLAEPGGMSLVALEDGALVRHFVAPPAASQVVALSPDGRFAARGDIGGNVMIWDVASAQLHAVVAAHTRRVAALRFAADGRWLATGSWDETVRFIALDVAMPSPGAAEAAWGITLDAMIR